MATTTTTQTAPELTREQVSAMLIRPLEDASVFLQAGPRIFDTHGPLRLPKLGSVSDMSFIGEGEKIPEASIDFDQIMLLPDTLKSVKVIHRYTNEMARQSVVALDATVKDALVRAVANKLDYNFLSATGDGITTPKGLFAYTDTQEIAVDGPLEIDDLHDAMGLAMAANVNIAATRWLIRSEDFVALRKLKDSTGNYVMQSDVTKAGAFSLLGQPVTVTNRVPEGRAALADFSQVAVARDLSPSVTLLNELFADTDEKGIRVVARMDAAPLNPEAIVTFSGVGTSAGA